MALVEREECTPSTVRYILDGELDEVVTRMREILRRYHPYGYGTKLEELGAAPVDQGHDGRWRCVIRRAASCD